MCESLQVRVFHGLHRVASSCTDPCNPLQISPSVFRCALPCPLPLDLRVSNLGTGAHGQPSALLRIRSDSESAERCPLVFRHGSVVYIVRDDGKAPGAEVIEVMSRDSSVFSAVVEYKNYGKKLISIVKEIRCTGQDMINLNVLF